MRNIKQYAHCSTPFSELDFQMNALEAGDLLKVHTEGEVWHIAVLEVLVANHDRQYVFGILTEKDQDIRYPINHFMWCWDQEKQNFVTECWTFGFPRDATFSVEQKAVIKTAAIYERELQHKIH